MPTQQRKLLIKLIKKIQMATTIMRKYIDLKRKILLKILLKVYKNIVKAMKYYFINMMQKYPHTMSKQISTA